MNLSEYNIGDQSPQSCLFVGESGTGKSIAAVDWKRDKDDRQIYLASCDGRIASVAEWHRGRKDIVFEKFNTHQQLRDKIDWLIQECPYQTVIVDPITNISSFLMRHSFSLRGMMEYDEATGTVKHTSKGRKRGSTDLTGYDDINFEHRGIEDYILDMRLIQEKHNTTIILIGHVLVTTYMKIGGSESNMRKDILTAGRKIVPFIPTQFDEFYHFKAEAGRWFVQTYNDGVFAARSSFITMPPEIEWTKSSLFDKVRKYYFPNQAS